MWKECEFLKEILLEDNPYENEKPVFCQTYDLASVRENGAPLTPFRDEMTEEFCRPPDPHFRSRLWYLPRPFDALSAKEYRGVNSLWLSVRANSRKYEDPRWCTFQEANSQGWRIKKGEHSTQVEYWSLYDKQLQRNLPQSEAEQILASDPSREKDMVLTVRQYRVFNAEQLTGVPPLQQSAKVTIKHARDHADCLLKNMGVVIFDSPSSGKSNAIYIPSCDQVTVDRRDPYIMPFYFMSSLLFSCAAATAHESRMNRQPSQHPDGWDSQRERFLNQLAALFAGQSLGFGPEARRQLIPVHYAFPLMSTSYAFDNMIRRDPNELFASIKTAEAISDYLLEKGEFFMDHPWEHDPSIYEPDKPSIYEIVAAAEARNAEREAAEKRAAEKRAAEAAASKPLPLWKQRIAGSANPPKDPDQEVLPETDLLGGILLEEDPYGDEKPAFCQTYDLAAVRANGAPFTKFREEVADRFTFASEKVCFYFPDMWYHARPQNVITQQDFRGVNSFGLTLLSVIQDYQDPRWCTFQQAKSRGWRIKKGEHSTLVEYWSLYDKQLQRNLAQSEAEQILTSDPSREKDMVLTSRQYRVFNAQQMDGPPRFLERCTNLYFLSSYPNNPHYVKRTERQFYLHPIKMDVTQVRSHMERMLQNLGVKVASDRSFGGYNGAKDRISLSYQDCSSSNDYHDTCELLLRCAEATGHPSRLNRDGIDAKFASPSQQREELRSSLGAFFAVQSLGFGVGARLYYDSWSKLFFCPPHLAMQPRLREDPNQLFSAIKVGEAIADYLLEKGEFFLEQAPAHDVPKEGQGKPSLNTLINFAEARTCECNSIPGSPSPER